MCEVCSQLVLLDYFAFSVSVSLCVRTYHVYDNYVMYIVAMQPFQDSS